MTTETMRAIETELARLGWDSSTGFVVGNLDETHGELLPDGIVYLADDWTVSYGNAEEILAALRNVKTGAEYGSGLSQFPSQLEQITK